MGEHKVHTKKSGQARAKFISHLLDDIQALEEMLKQDLIENNLTRIGAEQEFCLVSENWRPATNSPKIIKAVNDPNLTTELALYNLEINLDPVKLGTNCFLQIESQLNTSLEKVRIAAANENTKILLTGILPTISKHELEFEYITPDPRYFALNEMMKELRGTDFNLHLTGVDELSIAHDSLLFEACNTSFQMHLQIAPDDFIASYNWAQAISGPFLGIAANSPLLLGRELWNETRIALFQQSIDIRSSSYALKDQLGRVTFGESWANGTIVDIFKNEISHHRVILTKDIKNRSMEELEKGTVPKLQALSLYNSTIYRWNRPCYGVHNGKAHLRIENRYIPSGPSVIDEMANFAFWVGLMVGRPNKFNDLPSKMDFKDVKLNFIKTARTGKESILNWMGKLISVRDLILEELLPIAYAGLEKATVNQKEIDRFLGIIEQRAKGMTGSQWKTANYRKLCKHTKQDEALVALTKTIYDNQIENHPVHEWPILETVPETSNTTYQAGHIMSTQLFTVNEDDIADLATRIMQWKNIHHVPVENTSGQLCGILTWTHMKHFRETQNNNKMLLVGDIMAKKVQTVNTHDTIQKVIDLMRKHNIGCLPVVQNGHLVGIITIKDVIKFSDGKSI